VEILLNRVSPKFQLTLNLITSFIGTVICFIIFWWSTLVTWDNLVREVYVASLLEPSKGLLMAVIPVGSFFLTTEFMRKNYAGIRSLKEMRNR
jgi:TRAP-type C4-dicarboxylate transport system permease small subunit